MGNNGTMPGFIPDGYTREGFIKASDWHPGTSLSFEYRPMTQTERVIAQKRVTDAKSEELGENEAFKIISERLISWDLEYDGSAVELTLPNVSRLEPHLGGRLFNVVMGYETDDSAELTASEQLEKDQGN